MYNACSVQLNLITTAVSSPVPAVTFVPEEDKFYVCGNYCINAWACRTYGLVVLDLAFQFCLCKTSFYLSRNYYAHAWA